ncbi:PhoH family protein [Streptomyces sp. MZ04]|uniref:PhoH family protein n=1 Tax=Streptomyces sp. MZ04 TaxID=2559236 RepID=UPI00107EC4A2|nr:PhoH family protein [Streptomyces sp. MZ04]TGA92731.1 phosphate starvation-inducible protein PhoH [Streptomyces sp. MZ04]
MTQTPTAHTPAQGQSRAHFTVPANHPMVTVLGSGDALLRVIEKAFPAADIHVRGNDIRAVGDAHEVALIQRLFDEMMLVLRTGQPMTEDAVERSIAMLKADEAGEGDGPETPAEVLTQNILSSRGRTIRPKTLNQKRYVDAIDKHTIVFGIGPAGTGKTYLAMAKAVQALQSKQVNRIILTRPAVEAGERLGFLPGTLYEKIDPYLRPLYDALHDMLDPDSIPRLMAAGTIEVAPLAYMRGRAMPTFTNVLTPSGWRPIGGLEVGDLVIGSNGEPTPVLGVYPQGEKDIYRLSAQDGSWTLCCGEHLWTVRTASDRRRNKPWRVLETQDMIGNLRAAHARRYELPLLTAPVCFPEREVPIDPYALGLLLGDGCISAKNQTPSFTTADPELILGLEAALPGIKVRSRGGYDYLINRAPTPSDGTGSVLTHPLKQALRSLDLLGTRSCSKFVPDDYLYNSAAVRLAVLQGLLDTDGGPVTQSDRTCRVQYTTTSILLRDDVIALVQSLGGVAYTKRRYAEGRPQGTALGKHKRDAHIIEIRLPEGIEPFRLARKRDKYHAAGGGGRPMRFIDSIEPAGREEAVCIQVAAEDSLYVTQDYLLTHNTLNDAFIILDEAQNTSAEQMKMFLTRLGFDSKIVITGDVTQVDLPGGTKSGLRQVQHILEGLDDVHFSRLTSSDVVRHKLVGRIVDAYEKYDDSQQKQQQSQQSQQRRKHGK